MYLLLRLQIWLICHDWSGLNKVWSWLKTLKRCQSPSLRYYANLFKSMMSWIRLKKQEPIRICEDKAIKGVKEDTIVRLDADRNYAIVGKNCWLINDVHLKVSLTIISFSMSYFHKIPNKQNYNNYKTQNLVHNSAIIRVIFQLKWLSRRGNIKDNIPWESARVAEKQIARNWMSFMVRTYDAVDA